MNAGPASVRRVAIFGASSAIATAVARRYAVDGAELFLAGRRRSQLERLAADLRVRGAPRVLVADSDLADPNHHATILATARQAFDHPDVALVAWGTLTDQAVAEADPGYAVHELRTNFMAPAALLLRLADWFAPAGAPPQDGVIAVITSVAGDRGRRSNFVYGSAKGGLQRFLEGLRHRLFASGVVVLDIRPGFVATPMTEHLPQGGLLWATPTEVAGDIVEAIAKRRQVLYTRWFWRWIMLAVTSIPRAVFHRTKL